MRSIGGGVRDIHFAHNRIVVSVFGLIPRPWDNGLYERAKLRTNQYLRGELARFKEDITLEHPSMDEIRKVLGKLKNNNGVDGIPY